MIITDGLNSLHDTTINIGIPYYRGMTAIPCKSYDEVEKRMGEDPFTAEFKYDGIRVQVNLIFILMLDSLRCF